MQYTVFLAGDSRPFHSDFYIADRGQRHEVIHAGTSPRADKSASIRRPIPAP